MTDFPDTNKSIQEILNLIFDADNNALGISNDEIDKIDSKTVLGLLGVSNSLAYKVHEIEKHLHSSGSWFGKAATPSGEVHVADRIGAGILPFEVDAGDSDWGAWTQILGSSDTPARIGQVKFDPHEMVITYAERAGTYFIQFARGDSGAAGYSSGNYTEIVYESDSVGVKATGITDIQTGRADAGSKIWCRTLCVGENTSLVKFYFGIHEYQG